MSGFRGLDPRTVQAESPSTRRHACFLLVCVVFFSSFSVEKVYFDPPLCDSVELVCIYGALQRDALLARGRRMLILLCFPRGAAQGYEPQAPQ
jgi:hypothetical protein